MSVLRVLNGSGDASVQWDPDLVEAKDPEALAAVAEAERLFRSQRQTGALAFNIVPGKSAERITEFDPRASEVLVVPALVGG
jgi:hypothetical protein